MAVLILIGAMLAAVIFGPFLYWVAVGCPSCEDAETLARMRAIAEENRR